MRTDSMGRRRTPGQERGLRPLFPPLPAGLRSRVMRVAMSAAGWRALDQAIARSSEPTAPRAAGSVIERLLGARETTDWLQWQIRKEQQLLRDAS